MSRFLSNYDEFPVGYAEAGFGDFTSKTSFAL